MEILNKNKSFEIVVSDDNLLPVVYKSRVRITILYSPFLLSERKESEVVHELGKPVAEYVSEKNYLVNNDIDLIYSLNGRILDKHETMHVCPNPGDQIVVASRIHGGGIGRIVATIAVIAIAIWAPYLLGPMLEATFAGTSLAIAQGLVSAGGMFGGMMLVNALFPIAPPSLPTLGNVASPAGSLAEMDQTSTYGWSGLANLQNQGFPIPRLYGKRRVAGNIINRFLDQSGDNQFINFLISLGEGVFTAIGEIQVNQQPLGNYEGVWNAVTFGRTDQEALQYFGETLVRQSYNDEITDDSWVTKIVRGDLTEGLRIEIYFPNGLYLQSLSDSSLNPTNVELRLEYRPVTDPVSSWINYTYGSEGGSESYTDYQRTSEGFVFSNPSDYIKFSVSIDPYIAPTQYKAQNCTIKYRLGEHEDGDNTGWVTHQTYTWIWYGEVPPQGRSFEVTISGIGQQRIEVKKVLSNDNFSSGSIDMGEVPLRNPTRYINTGGSGNYLNIVSSSNSPVRRTYNIQPLDVGEYEVRLRVFEYGGTTIRHINKIFLAGISQIVTTTNSFVYWVLGY